MAKTLYSRRSQLVFVIFTAVGVVTPQTLRVVPAAIPLPPHHGRKTIGILTRAARKQPQLVKDGLIILVKDPRSLDNNNESAHSL